MQTSSTNPSALLNNPNVQHSINGPNSAAWKNRCSEKRDRINAQNMQIALEKEFRAKGQLIEENQQLKQDLDLKQHKINDLQQQIDQINKDLAKNQLEIKELKDELLSHQTQLASNGLGISNARIVNSHLSQIQSSSQSSDITSTSFYSSETINTSLLPSGIDASKQTEDTQIEIETLVEAEAQNVPETQIPIQVQQPAQLQSQVSTVSSASSTQLVQSSDQIGVQSEHKFEVVSFQTIERCECCCGIMYGVCRQAVRCRGKGCAYLCHTKCRQNLPTNCPININQRVKLKSVSFSRGTGTLMEGHLKVPKAGGVKKGWQEHYVFLSNARLFVCPIVDQKPSLTPVLIVDLRDPQFSASPVNEADVIHASKRDIPCILKIIVSKLKSPLFKQKFLFCAKDEKDKLNWINVLKDLNERLVQLAKLSSDPSSCIMPAFEAREICDATSIRNANSACVYDAERLLIASDEGIDVIDIKTDCTIQRFHDKKAFLIDVCREEKLIIAISGKNHQIFLFPTIVIEGLSVDICKIEETKGCNLFCVGKLILTSSWNQSPKEFKTPNEYYPHQSMSTVSTSSSSSSSTSTQNQHTIHLLCVAIKKVVTIYEINSSLKPKYKKIRDIELTMSVQSLQIINNQLCIGFQSEFALYSLAHETAPTALLQPDKDKSLQFLIKDPINALMAVQITNEEYLLVFESNFLIY